MSQSALTADLAFPRPTPPAPGEYIEIAPGVLWFRFGLPFQLNHVNIYLIEDGDGWAAVDTGLADLRTRTAWESIVASRLPGLGGRPPRLTRLIVTHYHPDHVGLAGWMCERFGIELWMSQTEFLLTQVMRRDRSTRGVEANRAFYARHGLEPEAIDAVAGRGGSYIAMTGDTPPSFRRLEAGQTLRFGGRQFEVLTGGGHAHEQAMLFCRDPALFLPGDQVLARISPNISVYPWEPEGNPLGTYLRSLAALRAAVPDDVLVLPAHNLPFVGLHQRIDELTHHHALRCAQVTELARERPCTAADVLPAMFPRALDAHQTGFAFGEVLAHVNYLLHTGELVASEGPGGVRLLLPG
jgi:glyoxylase-like metal-dependent hydrolase (beta-lactamase superfamily II)